MPTFREDLHLGHKVPLVESDDILNGAVTNEKLSDGAVTTEKIADEAVTNDKIAENSINGSKFADNSIDNDKVIDGTLSGAKFADNTITGEKIVDNSVPGSKIADGSIESVDIKDNTLDGAKLVDNTINGSKIKDNQIESRHLMDNSIPAEKIKDGTIENVDIKDGTLSGTKIKDNTIESGKLADGAVSETKITNGAVTTAKINDGAVTTGKLYSAAVTTEKLADGSITTVKIADDAITTDKISNANVTTAKINDSAVTTGKVADSAVTTAKIADANVTTAKIADEAVTEDKLADGAVTTAKLADGLISQIENITDATPTASSVLPVQSGGVFDEIASAGVYDVSAKNPTAGSNNDGKWESLSALLSDANLNTIIPTSVRKGGMSIKFVQSSDNKYVYYALNKPTWSKLPCNWTKISNADDLLQLEVNQLLYKNTAQQFTNLVKVTGENRNYLCITCSTDIANVTVKIQSAQSSAEQYTVATLLSNGTLKQGDNFFYVVYSQDYYLYISSPSNVTTFCTLRTMKQDLSDKFTSIDNSIAGINTSLNGKASKTDVNTKFNGVDERLDTELYVAKTAETTISASYTAITIATSYLCIDATNDVASITISIHDTQSQSSSYKEVLLNNGSLRKGLNVFKVEATGEKYLYVSSTSGLKYSFVDSLATKINENTTGLAAANNKITTIENEITDVLGVEICDFTTTGSGRKLDHPLVPNIEYILEIRNSVPNSAFRFSTTGTSTGAVVFILDGERITGWISPIQAGVHTLKVESIALEILVNGVTESNPASFHIYKKNVNEDIKELAAYTEKIKSRTDYMYRHNYACIDDYINSVGVKNWASLINGKALANNMYAGEIGVIRPEALAHDSQIVVKDGIAYVVFSSNTELIDNPSSPTCKAVLSVFDLNDFEHRTDLIVAANGSHSDAGAGGPNIYADVSDNDLLHITYIGREDSKNYIYTCDYSISGASCSNYRKVVLHKGDEYCYANGAEVSELFDKNVGGLQANSSIAYLNGWYYMAFVKTSFTDLDNQFEVVFKTQNFTDWYYFVDCNVLDNPSAYEVAVGTDGTYIFTASRPKTGGTQYNATFGVISKWNTSGTNLQKSYYKNCSSRPAFFNYDGNLYLFSNRWYRAICDIIKIDTVDIQRSELVFQFKYPNANYYYHYPSFAINGSNIVSSSSAFFITINQFAFPTLITEDGVYNKIEDIFLT